MKALSIRHHDLIRPHLEPCEVIRPEGVADRHIGCVAAATNQYPADAGKRNASTDVLKKIADALGLAMDDLV